MTAFVRISIAGEPNEVAQVLFTIGSRYTPRPAAPTLHQPAKLAAAFVQQFDAVAATAPHITASIQTTPPAPTTSLERYQPFWENQPPEPVPPPRAADWTTILVAQYMSTVDERALAVLNHLKSHTVTGSSRQAITLHTGLNQRQIAAVASYSSRKLRSFHQKNPTIILPRPFAINSNTNLYHIDRSFAQAML